MKKRIQFIIFIIILSLSLGYVYHIVSWKDTSGAYISSLDQLYATDSNLIDVAFIGSSHCYCDIQPSILWEERGIASFDMAISGMDKESAYYTLIELLKKQNPEVVFVDGYALLNNGYAIEGNKYRNLMQMNNSLNNYRLINKVDPKHQWEFFFRWPIVHTRYRELQKYDFVTNKYCIYGRGEIFEWTITQQEPADPNVTEQVGELSEENMRWMRDLMDLSEQEDFELVFCMLPMYITPSGQETVNAATLYAQERGYAFIDFIQNANELGLDNKQDYCDDSHLNMFGAQKITEYFRDYLDENYELVDHRADSDYYQWDMDLCYRQNAEYRYQLNTANSIDTYMNTLKEMKNVTILVSYEGNEITPNTANALRTLGVDNMSIETGGITIIDANKQVTTLPRSIPTDYYLELSKYDTLRVLVGESSFDVWCNGKVENFNKDGLYFIVYDNTLEEYISTYCY